MVEKQKVMLHRAEKDKFYVINTETISLQTYYNHRTWVLYLNLMHIISYYYILYNIIHAPLLVRLFPWRHGWDVLLYRPTNDVPFLRLSSLAMMMSWVWLAEVWAEKFMMRGCHLSALSSLRRKCWKRYNDYNEMSEWKLSFRSNNVPFDGRQMCKFYKTFQSLEVQWKLGIGFFHPF